MQCSTASGFAITPMTNLFPALFLSYDSARPLHVVAACDEVNKRAFVITAHEPSLDVFEADYKTKRK